MKTYLETYGCQMNVNESHVLSQRLVELGHEIVTGPEGADMVLLNTCSIREHAEQKVLSRLGVLRKLKDSGDIGLLGVTGCMAQRLGGEFLARAPFLDLVIGSGAYPRFFEALTRCRETQRAVVDVGYAEDFQFEDRPALEAGAVKTFITIIRGCNNACNYCIVPTTRGYERSKPLGQIIREAEWCAARGVREITLLGQNVNHYRWEDVGLAKCLREVAQVGGLHRLRYTTSHPGYMTDDVLVAMSEEQKIMPQLHLPLQSGSNRILSAMNREYTVERYLELINRARDLMPNLALSTDIIVGYPGENEEDFRETYRIMEEIGFDSAYMFKFSPRRGTVAAGLQDDVAREKKQKRLAAIIGLQRSQTQEKSETWIGREVDVLIESVNPRNPSLVTGKTEEFRTGIMPGEAAWGGKVVKMRVDSARGVTLKGTPVES